MNKFNRKHSIHNNTTITTIIIQNPLPIRPNPNPLITTSIPRLAKHRDMSIRSQTNLLMKLGQPALEIKLPHLHLIERHQRMRIGQLLMTLLTDIEATLRIRVHRVPLDRIHQSAEVTDSLLVTLLLHPRKGMPHRTLTLRAGQGPALMAEDGLLIGSGAIDADGGTDGLSSTEIAEFPRRSIEVRTVLIELGESLLVQEVKLVTFGTHEQVILLALLLEGLGHVLAGAQVETVLVYPHYRLGTELRVKGTPVLRLELGQALDAEGLGAAIGTLLEFHLQMGSTAIAEDLLTGTTATDDLRLELVADRTGRLLQLAGVQHVVFCQKGFVHWDVWRYIMLFSQIGRLLLRAKLRGRQQDNDGKQKEDMIREWSSWEYWQALVIQQYPCPVISLLPYYPFVTTIQDPQFNPSSSLSHLHWPPWAVAFQTWDYIGTWAFCT